MLTKHVLKLGVEMEGYWTRFNSKRTRACNHTHKEKCLTWRCECLLYGNSQQLAGSSYNGRYGYRDKKDCKSWEAMLKALPDFDYDNQRFVPNSFENSSRCWGWNCDHRCSPDSCPSLLPDLKSDGSISTSYGKPNTDKYFAGEIASPPFDDWNKLNEYVLKTHPDYVNKSCGLHVHISISDAHYDAILDNAPGHYQLFKEKLLQWAIDSDIPSDSQLWARIKGDNQYCKPNDVRFGDPTFYERVPSELMAERKKIEWIKRSKSQAEGGMERYTHINYCRHKHGTIEFRVFNGMTEPAHILSAARLVTYSTDLFLDSIL